MIYSSQEVETYKALHNADANQFVIVSANDTTQLQKNFKAYEFYNSKNKLRSHPVSITTVEALQFIRDYFNYRILVEPKGRSIGRTYRNYRPASGAKDSAHMRGEGIDFNFNVADDIRDELHLLIRADIEKKGPLFQGLIERGVTGFGIYDTFLHIDTVPVALYPTFKAKRGRVYQGVFYGYWDDTKKLKYLSPKGFLQTNGKPIENPPSQPVVTQATDEVKKAVGAAIGFVTSFTMSENDDGANDVNSINVGYLIAFLLGLLFLFSIIALLFKTLIKTD